MKSIQSLLLVAALAAPFAAANADQLGVQFSSPGTTFQNGDWSLGYEFSVSAPLTVTGLAVYNANFDSGPITVSDDVGLWTQGGSLIASGTVAAGTPDIVDPFFAAVAITPVVLGPGTYIVAAQNNGQNYAYDTVNLISAPGITYIQDEYISSGSLQFPTASSGITQAEGGAWFGGNIVVGTASAPDTASTWTLGLLGLAGIVAASRRQRATV
ncbi:MAG TPA: DUF4082 domain-containing protein [Opitutaceae bacterium]|jgi:MYXO-CTERM domain-containing protein